MCGHGSHGHAHPFLAAAINEADHHEVATLVLSHIHIAKTLMLEDT